jgi:hypothetical protein
MNDFKTYFNPLVPIGRLAFSIFSGGLTCFVIYLLFRDFNTNGLKQYLTIILGATIFGAIFQMFFKAFITTTKNYLITEQTIEEFNLLTLKTKTIYKDDIKGFSTSLVPYRIWYFKQIIIYLKDGTKIDIMQFAYFNFKEIKPTLVDKKYNYLGHESYIWKWVNSRVYKYEE